MSGYTYYRLKAREEVDNPDQRITEDVKSYTQTTLSFFLMSLNSAITSLAFLGRPLVDHPAAWCWSPSPTRRSARRDDPPGPPLVRLNNLQLQKEADLRYHLIQIREAAETIATLGAREDGA